MEAARRERDWPPTSRRLDPDRPDEPLRRAVVLRVLRDAVRVVDGRRLAVEPRLFVVERLRDALARLVVRFGRGFGLALRLRAFERALLVLLAVAGRRAVVRFRLALRVRVVERLRADALVRVAVVLRRDGLRRAVVRFDAVARLAVRLRLVGVALRRDVVRFRGVERFGDADDFRAAARLAVERVLDVDRPVVVFRPVVRLRPVDEA